MKKKLLSLSALALVASAAFAQATNQDVTKNGPTESVPQSGIYDQYLYEFFWPTGNASAGDDLNCITAGGTANNNVWDTFANLGGVSTDHFTSGAQGSSGGDQGTLKFMVKTADAGKLFSNRLVKGNCSIASAGWNLDLSNATTPNKVIKINFKTSVNLDIRLFAATNSGGSFEIMDGQNAEVVAYQSVTAGSNYQTLTFNIASTNWNGSKVIDWTKIIGVGIQVNNVAADGDVLIDWISLGGVDGSVNVADLKPSNNNVVVFPSPATDNVNVRFSTEENVTMSITDITGRVMVSEKVASGSSVNKAFNVSNYAEGMYFLNVTGATSQYTEKFMVK